MGESHFGTDLCICTQSLLGVFRAFRVFIWKCSPQNCMVNAVDDDRTDHEVCFADVHVASVLI